MTEIEVPVEKIHETIHEEAEHSKEKWISMVALTASVLAVFAAVAALLAGHHANEAMIEQIKSSDHWSFFQAKSIKSSILQSKMQLLSEMGRPANNKDNDKLMEYKKEQDEISAQAKEAAKSSEAHLHTHEILAKSVTLFQVAIAIAAVSVLVKRRKLWMLSMVFGFIGLLFLFQGLFHR